MDALVVDLTHGGVKIALELRKLEQFGNVYAYDIYNTLKEDEKHRLHSYNIKLLDNENDLKNYILNFIDNNDLKISNSKINDSKATEGNDLLIVNPVHSSFNIFNMINNQNYNSIKSIDSIKEINSINSVNYKNSIKEINHHKAVDLILNKWKKKLNHENIPIPSIL